MGLTSSVPNSILQPGVCTSTTRPAAPYHGQVVLETDTQKTLFYNGTAWVILNDPNAVSIDASGNVTFDNDVTVTGGFTPNVGYMYVQTLYFTSSGTFTKASYPWLRAVRIRVQGGGGGGAGAAASSYGAGGGGGGYTEKFLTDIASLSASETVTVGAGGTGGAAGVSTGSTGGTSSFDGVSATGGGGGSGAFFGGTGGSGSGGDIRFEGSDGGGYSNDATSATNFGGNSHLGGGARPSRYGVNGTGYGGNQYGGGAGGGGAFTTNQAGGVGASGIVILELFA